MSNCLNCNAALEPHDRFCSSCGLPVENPDGSQTEVTNSDIEPSFVDLTIERPNDPGSPAQRPVAPTPPIAQPAAPQPVVKQPVNPPSGFSEQTPEGQFEEAPVADTGNARKNLLLIAGVIGVSLMIGALYYWLFISDDIAATPDAPAQPAAKTEATAPAATATLFAVTQANIRDLASTKDSKIVGKLDRGEKVGGRLAIGSDNTSNWLELADGRGFVSAVNLAQEAPPPLTKKLNDQIWTTKEAVDILAKASAASPVLLRVPAGAKLTLVGITANNFIEVKMKQGGVGFLANASELLAAPAVTAPPIAISFNNANCGYGSAMDGLFQRLFAQAQSYSRTVEDADYPDADARNAALSALEGKSHYLRLERSFNGLTVTGIGQHYESTSVYFADPNEKVIATFKSLGYRVGSNGLFPEQEGLQAVIGSTSGQSAAYGKSDLSCGA